MTLSRGRIGAFIGTKKYLLDLVVIVWHQVENRLKSSFSAQTRNWADSKTLRTLGVRYIISIRTQNFRSTG